MKREGGVGIREMEQIEKARRYKREGREAEEEESFNDENLDSNLDSNLDANLGTAFGNITVQGKASRKQRRRQSSKSAPRQFPAPLAFAHQHGVPHNSEQVRRMKEELEVLRGRGDRDDKERSKLEEELRKVKRDNSDMVDVITQLRSKLSRANEREGALRAEIEGSRGEGIEGLLGDMERKVGAMEIRESEVVKLKTSNKAFKDRVRMVEETARMWEERAMQEREGGKLLKEMYEKEVGRLEGKVKRKKELLREQKEVLEEVWKEREDLEVRWGEDQSDLCETAQN